MYFKMSSMNGICKHIMISGSRKGKICGKSSSRMCDVYINYCFNHLIPHKSEWEPIVNKAKEERELKSKEALKAHENKLNEIPKGVLNAQQIYEVLRTFSRTSIDKLSKDNTAELENRSFLNYLNSKRSL